MAKVVIAQWVLDQSLGKEFLAVFAGGNREILNETPTGRAYVIKLTSKDGALTHEFTAPKSAVVLVPDEALTQEAE